MHKVKTNFEKEKDVEIGNTAKAAIKGLKGNTDFTFTTQLSETEEAESDYSNKLAAVATGNSSAITVKNTAKIILETKLSVLATAVNLQAKGDLKKLQGSGLELAKTPEHNFQDIPENFKVERANIAGNMALSVSKPIVTNHGTVFAFWKPSLGATPANINDWFQRHCNGHHLTITGLVPNVPHPFAAAYKGNDNEPLVWSAITIMSPGD